ncbi:MAG: TetR/AcrR family transcriptional regulator [Polyangiaceae bacterium]|nr:TetR/AcrR family transcriptional regulator [Polyangiaceae bacterium]
MTREEVLPALAEVFREHGYEGASLTLLGEATGLGKGSLYHFFPGGKEEMVAAVLTDIDVWFETHVFGPLRSGEPERAITTMFDAVQRYFRSGRRVCLVGVLAVGNTRERFAAAVRSYFTRWIEALASTLRRAGQKRAAASALAEEVVGAIQGAIVLARALDDEAAFNRAIARLRKPLIPPRRGSGRTGRGASRHAA